MLANDNPQSSAKFENPLTLVFAVLTGIYAGAALLAIAFVSLGMDQLWLMYGAARVLAHAPVYGAEVMESNPPFILWINAIPVALSHALHQPEAFGFRCCVVLVTLAVLGWCCVLLRHLVTAKAALLGWAFAFGVCAFTFYLGKTNNIGEREHLMTLFILPYLFGAALRLRGVAAPTWECIAMGLSGAIAVCCKPQHLLLIIGIELLLAIHRRSLASLLRAEFFAAFLGCCAYLGAVEVFAPSYIHVVVPLLRQTYWAFGGIPLLTMFLQKRSLMILLAALLCGAIGWVLRRRMQSSALLATLVTASLGSLAAYWAQTTGFGYQIIPAASFLMVAYSVLAADLLTSPLGEIKHQTVAPLPGSGAVWPPKPIPPLAPWIAPVLALVVCCVFVVGLKGHFHRSAIAMSSNDLDPRTQTLLDSYPAGTPVYWMSLDPGMFPAVTAHGFVWASRFPHLWMVPAVVRTEQHQPHLKKQLTPEQITSLTATQDRFMVEDLERWHPKLVGVERCQDPAMETCEGMHGGLVDLLAWFQTDPSFQQTWSHYKFVETAGRYDYYALQE